MLIFSSLTDSEIRQPENFTKLKYTAMCNSFIHRSDVTIVILELTLGCIQGVTGQVYLNMVLLRNEITIICLTVQNVEQHSVKV